MALIISAEAGLPEMYSTSSPDLKNKINQKIWRAREIKMWWTDTGFCFWIKLQTFRWHRPRSVGSLWGTLSDRSHRDRWWWSGGDGSWEGPNCIIWLWVWGGHSGRTCGGSSALFAGGFRVTASCGAFYVCYVQTGRVWIRAYTKFEISNRTSKDSPIFFFLQQCLLVWKLKWRNINEKT